MSFDTTVKTLEKWDDGHPFTLTVLETSKAEKIIVFAAGRGGNPLRHMPLLKSIAGHGWTVVAPHFPMLASPVPTLAELNERKRWLELSADEYALPGHSIAGCGHSIGAVSMLALAGAEARTRSGERLSAGSRHRFNRLVLFAPPADFFRFPDALANVDAALQIRVGEIDDITPPTQAMFLKDALLPANSLQMIIDKDAGHFTYMDILPPHIKDGHPNRSQFLAAVAEDTAQFLLAK